MLTLNIVIVLAVVVQRLVELRVSVRHRRVLAEEGTRAVPDPVFAWMVLAHALLLVGVALEPWLLDRAFLPWLGWPALAMLVVVQGVRIWVIKTLGRHWNVRIMASCAEGIVADGPYRWVRHPNYVVVAAESVLLPLFHGAWITLLLVQFLHVPVLWRRIRAEEEYLMTVPEYRQRMGGKPRLFPRLVCRESKS